MLFGFDKTGYDKVVIAHSLENPRPAVSVTLHNLNSVLHSTSFLINTSVIQDLDKFKSHPPLHASDRWGEDYRDIEQIAPIHINSSPAKNITLSGKTAQQASQRRCKFVINPDDNVDISATAVGDTRTAAQGEEDRRCEEATKKKNL